MADSRPAGAHWRVGAAAFSGGDVARVLTAAGTERGLPQRITVDNVLSARGSSSTATQHPRPGFLSTCESCRAIGEMVVCAAKPRVPGVVLVWLPRMAIDTTGLWSIVYRRMPLARDLVQRVVP